MKKEIKMGKEISEIENKQAPPKKEREELQYPFK